MQTPYKEEDPQWSVSELGKVLVFLTTNFEDNIQRKVGYRERKLLMLFFFLKPHGLYKSKTKSN